MSEMKITHVLLLVFLFFFISENECKAVNKFPPRVKPDSRVKSDYKPDEILIKFIDGTIEPEKQSARNLVNAILVKELKGNNIELWKIKGGVSIKETIKLLKKIKSIEFAEPNYIFQKQKENLLKIYLVLLIIQKRQY